MDQLNLVWINKNLLGLAFLWMYLTVMLIGLQIKGEIKDIFYKPGKFLNASLDKASEENERNYYKIEESKSGETIIVVQIAGLIARRIVTQTAKNQIVHQGQRIGMIRFGSRVDVYFTKRKTLVKVGQNVIAGESLIAGF